VNVNGRLFDRKTAAMTMVIKCEGCRTTATVMTRQKGLVIPDTWVACGEATDGTIARWCGQCAFEGRHLRQAHQ
jgi:hypothetical protein